MLHRGIGTQPDWIAALDFLNEVKASISHWNSADVYETRILQEALIGLDFLDGKIDGDFGPKTRAALDSAIKVIGVSGPRPDQDNWYAYMLAEEFGNKGGWHSASSNESAMSKSISVQHYRKSTTRQISPVNPSSSYAQRDTDSNIYFNSKNVDSTLSPSELFRQRSESVHMIFAAKNLSEFQSFESISQGSAVAISDTLLVTNCHVISDNKFIVFLAEGIPHAARFVKGTQRKDACILKSDSLKLNPVKSFRSIEAMAVGEVVYAIGSPRGQENTLSQGLLSGKRKIKGISYLQTNASISSGSSGGGLFDQYGNLVGITTMMLKDSQALNFAIAIEEFR
ncbi:Trypsin-like peptidase domain-containing protein [Nitrosomonas cryotolerans]|uniref:Trypsin-like peptidase domain-containing protein n=1 Tax=Nitrosomonas cryotolerans ATCC 49181 TaxID=1131553 RepID=A0A1N6F670_9PROT|nr:trypsin-like peptidase domain-containing protein [Nitrosomonas cryotolerans]SFP98601.1 Trypsin-like peptidase domain-containing protein [Nitrosomonas cryotolerans]SIN90767.1 Trypsin-like peptidase domain-containing protein [Nitrosomonas cryotolerans ATCC 49181]